MAVACGYASGLSLASSSNVTTYTTTTGTFASGVLYICFVAFDDAEATAEVPTSVVLSGSTPPTVTRVTGATATYNTVASPLNRITTWWWVGDGVSRTITVTQPDAGTGCIIYTCSVTGADNAAPIVQGVGNQGDAGTTASATLAAFADATNNGALVFVGIDAANNLTAESGGVWVERNSGTDISHTVPVNRVSAAFRTGQDTSPTMGIASASDWGCVAVEIKAVVDATFTTTVGDAPAAGGDSSFTGAGVFDTVVGVATAAGGVTTFDVTGAPVDATFTTTVGDAPAAGGSTSFSGTATFTTTVGDAPAAGGSTSFSGTATFDTVVGEAVAAGGVTTFDATTPAVDATFTTTVGTGTAAGGSTSFDGTATFDTVVGAATADGGSTAMTGTATFDTAAGSAAAAGGSTSFDPSIEFASIVGQLLAEGGTSTLTGGAVFDTTAGILTASGGVSYFVTPGRPRHRPGLPSTWRRATAHTSTTGRASVQITRTSPTARPSTSRRATANPTTTGPGGTVTHEL